jgi:hypothetical protein
MWGARSFNPFAAAQLARSRRKLKKVESFSPSYGVRNGYVADVERPTAKNQRAARRVPTSFDVFVDGVWRHVAGDVSAGGALFLLPEGARIEKVTIVIKGSDPKHQWKLSGIIRRISRRGERFAHHVQFTDVSQTEGLAELLEVAVDPVSGRWIAEP